VHRAVPLATGGGHEPVRHLLREHLPADSATPQDNSARLVIVVTGFACRAHYIGTLRQVRDMAPDYQAEPCPAECDAVGSQGLEVNGPACYSLVAAQSQAEEVPCNSDLVVGLAALQAP
jgi:hypothetical protein